MDTRDWRMAHGCYVNDARENEGSTTLKKDGSVMFFYTQNTKVVFCDSSIKHTIICKPYLTLPPDIYIFMLCSYHIAFHRFSTFFKFTSRCLWANICFGFRNFLAISQSVYAHHIDAETFQARCAFAIYRTSKNDAAPWLTRKMHGV